MPRSPDSLEDPTPLDSATLDVRRRTGWLLRTTRLHSGPRIPATEFARRLGVPATAVSRWEKGGDDPDATALMAYERELQIGPGVLRATVAGLRREFNQPARRTSVPETPALGALSERVRAALEGDADGNEWLTFATTLSEGSLALPDFLARPAFDRLVSQTVRAVDGAYLTRMEALALLRTGPYHQVVRESCLDFALADEAQVSADAIGVLGVRPDGDLLRSVCDLLTHPGDSVFSGACHAISTMRHTTPALEPDDLRAVAPVVVAAYAASLEDPERHAALSALLRQLPRGFRKLAAASDLPALAAPPLAGTAHDYEAAWSLAGSIAVEVMHRLDARPEPLLARTLFEALTDRWTVRSFWARCTLMVLPYRETVGEVVARHCAEADEEQLAALGNLVMHLGRAVLPLARSWVDDSDVQRQQHGLGAIAHAERRADLVDTERLRELLGSPVGWVRRRATYAAGMTGSPVLESWARERRLDPASRAAARWWLEQGARVDDDGPPGPTQARSGAARVEDPSGAAGPGPVDGPRSGVRTTS